MTATYVVTTYDGEERIDIIGVATSFEQGKEMAERFAKRRGDTLGRWDTEPTGIYIFAKEAQGWAEYTVAAYTPGEIEDDWE